MIIETNTDIYEMSITEMAMIVKRVAEDSGMGDDGDFTVGDVEIAIKNLNREMAEERGDI